MTEQKKAKKASPNKELEEQKKLASERLDQLKYLQADFDNYRKQFDKEKQAIIRLANENLIKECLVLLDDFERSLEHSASDHEKQGLSLLYKNTVKILEQHGLEPIEALDKTFDPHVHEVLQKETSEKEEGTIIAVFQTGYKLRDKVLRPAKVKVAVKE